MSNLQACRRALSAAALTAVLAVPAAAQLRSSVYVSGLTNPVAFVQDPSNAAIQYVAELGGVIRVVQNGTLLATPFANLSTQISTGGERGLLGLAFPPNYGSTGRFYVCFTNPSGNIVVARLRRSGSNPLVSDGSRFDFRWPGGLRWITHPLSNHNGGNIGFGPDGYLYVGLGDGGGGNDPDHNAQDPATAARKDAAPRRVGWRCDTRGLQHSAEQSVHRASRDTCRRSGASGCAIRGDGVSTIRRSAAPARWSSATSDRALREEIDYEPAGRGGRNYGWRNREGIHRPRHHACASAGVLCRSPIRSSTTRAAPANRSPVVSCIAAPRLGASYRGRYFFADCVSRRVWSIGLDFSGGAMPRAINLIDHTAELGGSTAIGSIASFGVDAAGELYLASFNGTIIRILPGTRTPNPIMTIDVPANGAVVRQPFLLAGWALDLSAAIGTGMSGNHVWAFPQGGGSPIFVGATNTGTRPDVAAFFGPQFAQSGYGLMVSGLRPGNYRLVVYGWVDAFATFGVARTVDVTIGSSTVFVIDTPQTGATVGRPFHLGGWAIDTSSATGTGIDTIHVWAFPFSGGPPVFVGTPTLGGSRPDVAGFFGARFTPSGYNMAVPLPPGEY